MQYLTYINLSKIPQGVDRLSDLIVLSAIKYKNNIKSGFTIRDGWVELSLTDIMDKIDFKLSKQNVRTSLNNLERLGLVKIIKKESNKPYLYKLTLLGESIFNKADDNNIKDKPIINNTDNSNNTFEDDLKHKDKYAISLLFDNYNILSKLLNKYMVIENTSVTIDTNNIVPAINTFVNQFYLQAMKPKNFDNFTITLESNTTLVDSLILDIIDVYKPFDNNDLSYIYPNVVNNKESIKELINNL